MVAGGRRAHHGGGRGRRGLLLENGDGVGGVIRIGGIVGYVVV